MAASAKPNTRNMRRRCHSSRRMQMPTGQATAGIPQTFQPTTARLAGGFTERLWAIRDVVYVVEAWGTIAQLGSEGDNWGLSSNETCTRSIARRAILACRGMPRRWLFALLAMHSRPSI